MAKTQADASLPGGWAQPGGGRKFHYFMAGDATSICRKWMLLSPDRFDENDESHFNCEPCKRLVRKLRAKGQAEAASLDREPIDDGRDEPPDNIRQWVGTV